MKTISFLGCAAMLMALVSCGCNDVDKSCSVEPTGSCEMAEEMPYDIDGIRSLTGERELSVDELNFLIDQYEIFCRETFGMDKASVEKYLESMGEDRAAIMYVVMDVAKSCPVDGRQAERLDEIRRKYNPVRIGLHE